MVARAAGDHVDAVDEVELLVGEPQLVDIELAAVHAPHERVAYHARLLVDLLEHEVGVAALLRHVDIPIDMGDGGLDRSALGIGVGDALGRETGELVVLEHHHVARGVDDGDDVGGHVAAARAAPDDDGAVLARHGDHARLVGAHRCQAVGAHHVRARLAHGGHEVARARARRRAGGGICGAALIGLLDEVGEDLGVGIALEHVAAARELLAQLGEVLDDAVVHHGDAAVAAGMRMRVGHAGASVRGPARVADAARRARVDIHELGLQARNLAHAADHVEHGAPALGALQRDARRVIAAVLQALEPGDQDVLRCVGTGVTNDAAHMHTPLGRVRNLSAAAGRGPGAGGRCCPSPLYRSPSATHHPAEENRVPVRART